MAGATIYPYPEGKPCRRAQEAAGRICRRFECPPSLSSPLIDVLSQTPSPFGVGQRARLAAQAIRASRRFCARHPEDSLPPEHAIVMLYHKVHEVPASFLFLCDAGVSKLSLAGMDRGHYSLPGEAPPRKVAEYMPIIRLKPRLALKAVLVLTAVLAAATQLGIQAPQISDVSGLRNLPGLVTEAGPAASSAPLADVPAVKF
jgi:hypothetical protein